MEHVISFGNVHNDKVGFIADHQGGIGVFAGPAEAFGATPEHPLLRECANRIAGLDEP